MADVSLLLEAACLAAARDHTFTATVNLYSGSSSPDGGYESSETILKLPAVIFHVTSAEPYVPRSQARRCRLRVIVRTNRDDENQASHRARASEVFTWVNTPDFFRVVNDYDGLTLFLSVQRGETETQSERHLESVLELDIDATPGNLS